MTTRGQKKTTETPTSNVSESGAVINMLTTNNPQIEQQPVGKETVPAVAKDISEDRGGERNAAAIPNLRSEHVTSPVKTKDGEPYVWQDVYQRTL